MRFVTSTAPSSPNTVLVTGDKPPHMNQVLLLSESIFVSHLSLYLLNRKLKADTGFLGVLDVRACMWLCVCLYLSISTLIFKFHRAEFILLDHFLWFHFIFLYPCLYLCLVIPKRCPWWPALLFLLLSPSLSCYLRARLGNTSLHLQTQTAWH